ncbi:MAG: hypothetical protein JXR70_18650 [Spirochaetales bacterium]|nr:hypothetical protein [Spirochaetales bacterium]
MKKIVTLAILIIIGISSFGQSAVDEGELMNLGEDTGTATTVIETQSPRTLSPLVAKQKAGALDNPQIRNIRALGIINKHFGADITAFSADFADLKNIYVNAKSLFLRGDYYNSYDQYLQCQAKSMELYQRAADFYKNESMKLLDQASAKVLDMEIEALVSDTPDEDKNRVTLAQGNLRIAFEYFNESDADYKAKRYQDTIDNCQAAKYYAINALINLEKDPQKAASLEESFDKDIRDALGRL